MSVGAIIPAFNEENTIGPVLEIITSTPIVDSVTVVSDGSEDNTVSVAMLYNQVNVIELLYNRGKGGAVKAGLDRCHDNIILILDADLIGLTEQHIYDLLQPVIDGKAAMTVGIFEKGRVVTDIAQKMAPFLSGQRALKRELLENISDINLSRFGIEVALENYADENAIAVEAVQLKDLSHVMKEEKLGFSRGISARAKMYWEILRYISKIIPYRK